MGAVRTLGDRGQGAEKGNERKSQAIPLGEDWNGLGWRSPPERRAKPCLNLLSRRRALAGSSRRSRAFAGVGHQSHVNPAILGPALAGRVGFYRLIFPQANQVNLVGRDVMLRCQILNNGVGATLAERVIVVGVTCGIGRTLHRDDVTLGVGNISRKLVERTLSVFGQTVFI